MKPDYTSLKADAVTRGHLIEDLVKRFDFLSTEIIGESRLGRPVELLSIGNRNRQVLFTAAYHGMEWMTSLIVLRFLDELCEDISNNRCTDGIMAESLLGHRGLAVIPCVNPDGVEIQIHGAKSAGVFEKSIIDISDGDTSRWQSNAAGVDINHNFNAGWNELHKRENETGISSPSPTRYGGEYPESEPETRAVASYCRAGNISHALALHTQGEEIYWDFDSYRDNTALDMAIMMSRVSGYSVAEPEGLAVGGGFKDWFVQHFNRPAFTIEAGLGYNPLPMSSFDSVYSDMRKLLVLATFM